MLMDIPDMHQMALQFENMNEGQIAPIIGRVSMDMITIDISNIPYATIGTSIELWGENLPIDDVAFHSKTVGYELMCALAPRVERSII